LANDERLARLIKPVIAGGAFIGLWWQYRRYLPPFGRIPRFGEPPIIFGELLGGCACKLENNQQLFLEECRSKYGNVFLLRLPCGKSEDIFGQRTFFGIVGALKQALLAGFKYQVVILDPYGASAIFTSRLVDRIPCSRQAIARFNVPKLMSTEEGVKALGAHLRKAQSGAGFEKLVETANDLFHREVNKHFTQKEWTQGPNLQTVAGGCILPAFMDLFYGVGFATERLQQLFRTYEGRVLFRCAGLDGSVPSDEVDLALLKELALDVQKTRENVSAMAEGLEDLKSQFGVPEAEVCCVKLAILWGANVNSQNVTTWTLAHICKDPVAQRDLEDEVARRLGRDWKAGLRSGAMKVTKADLDALPSLSSALWEVARRYGKANVMRSVARDGQITAAQPVWYHGHKEEQFTIRKGDWISTFPQLVHRDNKYFQDALDFRPFRFRVESTSEAVTRSARRCTSAKLIDASKAKELRCQKDVKMMKRELTNFLIPFGLGNGACPAWNMALDLVKILVLHVLANVDLRIEGDLPPAEEGGVHAVPPPEASIAYEYRLRMAAEDGVADFHVSDDNMASDKDSDDDVPSTTSCGGDTSSSPETGDGEEDD